MKPVIAALPPLFLSLAIAVISTSCGQPEAGETETIINDSAGTDLRKPAVPATEENNYPLYPQVRERGPEAVAKSGDTASELPDILKSLPAESGALEGAIAIAIKNAPAILEGIMSQSDSQTGSGSTGSLAPEILDSILKGEAEIPPELVESASEMIAEHAPGVIDSILSQQSKENESTAGAIAGMIFRKILESQTSQPATPKDQSNY